MGDGDEMIEHLLVNSDDGRLEEGGASEKASPWDDDSRSSRAAWNNVEGGNNMLDTIVSK